jgi:hypothetical protein
MDTSVQRPKRARILTLAGAVALFAMLLPAAAGVALGHTPSASLTCVNSAPTLHVGLTNYNGSYTNKVTITIDGVLDSTDSNANFGGAYSLTKTLSPATSSHSAVVVVLAGDDLTNAHGYSPTYNLTVPPCQKSNPALGTVPGTGGLVGTVLNDTATLTGGYTGAYSPTGSITFKLYGPNDLTCDGAAIYTQVVALSGNSASTSPGFTTLAAGTYEWTASYPGDTYNNKAASTCGNEAVVITKSGPTLPTTPGAGGLVGVVLKDTANLTGASSPTGSITFKLYGPNDLTCNSAAIYTQIVALSGSSATTSPGFTTVAAGTYEWTASYPGDPKNQAASSSCGNEAVVVKADPTIATKLSESIGTVGDSVHDSATLSGATATAGGTVTYTVYTDSSCTIGARSAGTVSVTGGLVPVSNALVFNSTGTWYWQAVYSGDAYNGPATSACTSETLVIEPSPCAVVGVQPNAFTLPTACPTPFMSFGGATATPTIAPTDSPTSAPTTSPTSAPTISPFQAVQGETATPAQTATPPTTSTDSSSSGDSSTPLFALMICLAFGGLGLAAVEAQRRSIRR